MSVKSDEKQRSFREVMDELDEVMADFEAAELDVEKALALHAQAGKLLDELEARLAEAEAKIKSTETN